MLIDRYERVIDYVRISVTDRCNLRCVYCFDGDLPLTLHSDILSYEEILRLVRLLAELGVRKVRLTGGEPLVRRNLPFLIREIATLSGIEDVSLTTNGVLLKEYAPMLRDAGLKRINVSLDSLRRERFKEITGFDLFDQVLEGIDMALKVGLDPVKINTVIIRGFNDDEVLDFVLLAIRKNLNVRFIEFMPFGSIWEKERIVTSDEIKKRIEESYGLEECENRGNGPARVYRVEGTRAEIGFISPLSAHICALCNRIRVTARGGLKVCLFSEDEYDLKRLLRDGSDDESIKSLVRRVIGRKPERRGEFGLIRKCQKMREIGG